MLIILIPVFVSAESGNREQKQATKGSEDSLNKVSGTDVETGDQEKKKIDIDKMKDANRLYREGKYGEALKVYSEAAAENPEHPVVNYNIGNVLYKTGKMDNAIEKYAASTNIVEAVFNTGNAMYRKQKLQEALTLYRQALIKNPKDLDAKFNYEFVKKKLEQQKKQDKDGDQGKDRKKQKNDKDQKQKNDKKQDKKQKDDKKKSQDKKNKQEKKRIDPEQAKSMLRALRQKEKELLREINKAQKVKVTRTKKDW